MRDIYLHGYLGQKYGEHFRFAVETPAAAIRLLAANFREFRHDLGQGSYRVVRGDPETGFHLTPESLNIGLGSKELHIIPVIAGGKNSGIGKAIIGAMIVATAIILAPPTGGVSLVGPEAAAAGGGAGVAAHAAAAAAVSGLAAPFAAGLTYGNIALFGAALALGGVTQLLSPQPSVSDYGSRETPDQRPSFLSNGPVNTTEQGGIRPLVFGRMIVGSVVISGGLAVEQI